MNKESNVGLARHFEVFIEDQLATGKYGTRAALIEDALRLLEAREAKLDALREALIAGERSGPATPFDMEEIKQEARARASRAA